MLSRFMEGGDRMFEGLALSNLTMNLQPSRQGESGSGVWEGSVDVVPAHEVERLKLITVLNALSENDLHLECAFPLPLPLPTRSLWEFGLVIEIREHPRTLLLQKNQHFQDGIFIKINGRTHQVMKTLEGFVTFVPRFHLTWETFVNLDIESFDHMRVKLTKIPSLRYSDNPKEPITLEFREHVIDRDE